jgi:hypothetical protein
MLLVLLTNKSKNYWFNRKKKTFSTLLTTILWVNY